MKSFQPVGRNLLARARVVDNYKHYNSTNKKKSLSRGLSPFSEINLRVSWNQP